MDNKLMKQLGIVELKKCKKYSKSKDWDVAIYVPFSEIDKNGCKSKVNLSIGKEVFVSAFGDDVKALSFGYTEKTNRLFIWIPNEDNDGYSISANASKSNVYVAVSGLYDIVKEKYFTDTDKKYFKMQYSEDLGEYFINLKEN